MYTRFMPKPKSKRIIVLQSSFSPTSLVGDFNLDMDASFDSAANVATVNIDEDTSTTGNESSEYQMSFALSSGAPIGVITLSFTGSGDAPAPGVSVAKTRAATETDPQATSGTVTPIANPDAFYERVWQQAVLDKKDELIDQVCGLDVRVKAATNYTVTQTVTATAEALLVPTYAWKDASGTALISGTVKLAASSAADVPRGLDFLLSRNRLNVAVSRAQWAAFLIHSPALADHLPASPAGLQQLGAYLTLLQT